MSKKRKAEKHKHSAASVQKKPSIPVWMIPVILVITFLAYIPALKAGFVNWDDGDYVYDNILIQGFSNFKALITTPVQGNYHPLTMISLAVNYLISGYDPWSYHLFNVIFHLINCYLVFKLALRLSNNSLIIAFTTSILFGVHPMHVESVAWVAERKDVLYGMFFIAGLISYTKFLDNRSGKQYGLTILFLILSLLSKPAAVIFPVALLSIDFLKNRPMKFNLLTEKAPFFLLAFAMGLLTYLAQKEVGATGQDFFGLGTRILFGFYGFMMYIIKLFLPFNIAPFYAFPAVNLQLPAEYFVAPFFFIAFALLFFYTRKNNREFAFGLLFYLINLLLVLQVLSVGSAVMADRYTYIPYIGLFFSLGWLIDKYFTNKTASAYYLIFPVSAFMAFLTYKQSSIWMDGASLWDHTIKVAPSARAYDNRATLLRKEKKHELAIEYYTKAISISAVDHEAYTNRGNNYLDLNKHDLAYNDYKKAISLQPNYHPALDNMGVWFAIRGNYDSAMKYFNLAIQAKPNYKPPYANRGVTFMELRRYQEAINDFDSYLKIDPSNADIINTKGSCLRILGKVQESLIAINQAIALDPKPAFFLNRSYSHFDLKNLVAAKEDVNMARQGGFQVPENYLRTLGMQ